MNTSIQSEITQLRGTDGQAVTLKSVHIEGRLDGLLLVMKSRQAYRNDGHGEGNEIGALQTVGTGPEEEEWQHPAYALHQFRG